VARFLVSIGDYDLPRVPSTQQYPQRVVFLFLAGIVWLPFMAQDVVVDMTGNALFNTIFIFWLYLMYFRWVLGLVALGVMLYCYYLGNRTLQLIVVGSSEIKRRVTRFVSRRRNKIVVVDSMQTQEFQEPPHRLSEIAIGEYVSAVRMLEEDIDFEAQEAARVRNEETTRQLRLNPMDKATAAAKLAVSNIIRPGPMEGPPLRAPGLAIEGPDDYYGSVGRSRNESQAPGVIPIRIVPPPPEITVVRARVRARHHRRRFLLVTFTKVCMTVFCSVQSPQVSIKTRL